MMTKPTIQKSGKKKQSSEKKTAKKHTNKNSGNRHKCLNVPLKISPLQSPQIKRTELAVRKYGQITYSLINFNTVCSKNDLHHTNDKYGNQDKGGGYRHNSRHYRLNSADTT